MSENIEAVYASRHAELTNQAIWPNGADSHRMENDRSVMLICSGGETMPVSISSIRCVRICNETGQTC